MPRQARLDAPGALHHVIGRGIEKTQIFRSRKDREDFLDRLGKLSATGALSIYAWALMDTHFHLLLRTGNQSISQSMRRLLTGYVVNFNRRHKRYGHLFQNRYKSILCEEDPYFLEVVRYIHLNPLRAGKVENVKMLGSYPWAGHSVIMGKQERKWQDVGEVLAHFGGRKRKALAGYEEYVTEGIKTGKRTDLTGGGLVRSLGGWAQVISARRRGEITASDGRILGKGEFVEEVFSEVEEKVKETLRWRREAPSLEILLGQVAREQQVEPEEIRRGSRRRPVVRARRRLCRVAKELGHSGAAVARYLGVTTSLVNYYASSLVR